jgi:AAA domain
MIHSDFRATQAATQADIVAFDFVQRLPPGPRPYNPQDYWAMMRVAEIAKKTEEIKRRKAEALRHEPPRGTVGAERVVRPDGDPFYTKPRVAKDDGSREHLLLDAWLNRKIPPRDYLLGSVLCTTSRWLTFGETGVGKTLLAGDIGGAVASGSQFLDWGGRRQARVMYLDGEMPAETFKERMQLIAERYGSDIPFFGYNRDDLGDGAMPPLNEEDGEKWLMREIGLIEPDLIIFDSIMCLLAGVMSEEESWGPVKHLVRRITSKKIGQIWLHHTGHDGTKGYGTKTREWEMDTVVRLAFADDNHEAVAMEFRKARLRTPQNHEQFGARTLSRGPDGWWFDAMSGKPMDGRKSAEVIKLKRAIVDAYSRLSDDMPLTTGFAGQQVRKVAADKLRDEVKRRGFLDLKETGGMTSPSRLLYHRAKTDLIASGRFVENDELFWRVK